MWMFHFEFTQHVHVQQGQLTVRIWNVVKINDRKMQNNNLPESWNFCQKLIQYGDVTFQGCMIRLDLLAYGRHAHVEKSLNFRVSFDTVTFWGIQSFR